MSSLSGFKLGQEEVAKRPYDKPATTYSQQIDILRSRGMIINNPDRAEFYLKHLNYYRLAGYWLPFEENHDVHRLQKGVRFESVLGLYQFDRELRLLLLDAIERIEVSLRSHWAFALGHAYGPHGYLLEEHAHDVGRHKRHLQHLSKAVDRSRHEQFVNHFTNFYSEQLPPIWAVCEVISLGLLSQFYGNIKSRALRKLIAQNYDLTETILASWLHHLSHIRNICAHHSRLWNRDFSIKPKRPRTKPQPIVQAFKGGANIYHTLTILLYFMDIIAPHHRWRARLLLLLNEYKLFLPQMGFPDGWQQHNIWRLDSPSFWKSVSNHISSLWSLIFLMRFIRKKK